jgi:hypothetical protein
MTSVARSKGRCWERYRESFLAIVTFMHFPVEGPFFSTTFSRPFKDQSGGWGNGTSFGLNDLEALMNVAFEAKEWITAQTLKR